MSLDFIVPGKTFLAGEYLALSGGPALIFASKPVFELKVVRIGDSVSTKSLRTHLHPDSPAGLFLKIHQDYFSQYSLQFSDSYHGLGGFGASTSQFLSLYALWLFQHQPTLEMEPLLDYRHLLLEYEKVAWKGIGQKPSGADLIGQLKGALTFFDKNQGLISVKSWPFQDLDFILAHTGNKVATHEHLKNLVEFSTNDLLKAFCVIQDAFQTVNSSQFVTGIHGYAAALEKLNFTCDSTLNLLGKIRKLAGVRAAKGCGALGADVILIVCDPAKTNELRSSLSSLNMISLTSANEVSAGLQIKGSL